MLEASRKLRKESTLAEQRLWHFLRDKRFCHVKFKRQYVIGRYIVDFVSLKHKLIIEVDGAQHIENAAYDEDRTEYLAFAGFTVIRFWNHEVLSNTHEVLQRIYSVCAKKCAVD